jgi:hypothetical protein
VCVCECYQVLFFFYVIITFSLCAFEFAMNVSNSRITYPKVHGKWSPLSPWHSVCSGYGMEESFEYSELAVADIGEGSPASTHDHGYCLLLTTSAMNLWVP